MNILKYILKKQNFNKLFLIFDIDGILLRYNNISNNYEFSPIIKNLFNFIKTNNIKWGIATHGSTFTILNSDISPIKNIFNKLNSNYIKNLISNEYKIEDDKYYMLQDLINQAILDYKIDSVIFFDDYIKNINKFHELSTKYKNINFKSNHILLNNNDIKNNNIYPLLRLSSFNSNILNFNEIFSNILSK